MKFDATADLLRKQVNGDHNAQVKGVAVPRKGLLEIVQAHVRDPADRETALLELGFVQGVASMLQGLTDKSD